MAQYKKHEVLNTIKEVAMNLFLEKGFEQTHIKDIAQGAEISVGNLYRYFANKQEILSALVPPSQIQALQDLLITRTHILHKMQLQIPLSSEEQNWYSNEYFDFLIANRKTLALIFKCRHETVFANAISSIVAEMLKLKYQLLGEQKPIEVPDDLNTTMQIIIAKTIELNAEVLSLEIKPAAMKRLLVNLDHFYQKGTAALWNKLIT